MKKKTYQTLVLIFALLSLICILCWYAYFIKEKSGFVLAMSLIFSASTLAILLKIVLNRRGDHKKNTKPVVEQPKEPKEPTFKKTVQEYKPDLSLVDTSEKALENFKKCFSLFKKISNCMDNYSVEYLLSEKKKSSFVNCLNASYGNSEFSNYAIWARLVTPTVDVIYNDEFRCFDHIPLLCTRYGFGSDQDMFDLFVSKFIEKDLVIRFHL